ncbi:MAG: DNA-processing protein DprA [Intestinibacter bartlettii]|uniref:DNA-processing protein DprA n=1 Tax=Intestinibacter bartlettii TaxID=261299 RepID=UPI0026ECE954|nr:DNA-processing protein DprA [Intestinibacter bartlettii]MDO5009450.1 DNA-processing protein DprA [Intestinibacter bartlettii]
MDNSLILTMIDLIGKRKTNILIENGFLNECVKLSQEDILKCIENYKKIDSSFEVPNLEKIQNVIENSVKTLLESYKLGIKVTNIFNDDFPQKLKDIKDRAILIFYRGDLNCLYEKKSIAVIGTRTPTKKGEEIGESLGYYYAKEGFVVVSGLANGCDTAAHKGCLKAGGKTVATLPCGLDKCYPNANNDLANEIVKKGGCLISEYKIGTNPSKEKFIQRDRLQAALSLGVAVVECAIECGTMHTVGFAQKYKKKIAVSLHNETKSDIETVKGNLYLLENKGAIGLNNIDDYKKYINILML